MDYVLGTRKQTVKNERKLIFPDGRNFGMDLYHLYKERNTKKTNAGKIKGAAYPLRRI